MTTLDMTIEGDDRKRANHQRASCPPRHETQKMHEIWRRVRRPFRYPSCRKCQWEVYDANQAGCLKCGKHHVCHANSVDSTCPLVMCDDRTRVCDITGFVLPEVRHAPGEFCDTVAYPDRQSPPPSGHVGELESEVRCLVSTLLLGEQARRCREQENAKQYARLSQHLQKQLRIFKLGHAAGELPCVCRVLACAMGQERYWRIIEEASEDLVRHCSHRITLCLLQLRSRGVRLTPGNRLQELVCGMLFMLKHGLVFRDQVLLSAIPEVGRCLPHENKIEMYFGISSKVICMTENEVKLVFRETYQP